MFVATRDFYIAQNRGYEWKEFEKGGTITPPLSDTVGANTTRRHFFTYHSSGVVTLLEGLAS